MANITRSGSKLKAAFLDNCVLKSRTLEGISVDNYLDISPTKLCLWREIRHFTPRRCFQGKLNPEDRLRPTQFCGILHNSVLWTKSIYELNRILNSAIFYGSLTSHFFTKIARKSVTKPPKFLKFRPRMRFEGQNTLWLAEFIDT